MRCSADGIFAYTQTLQSGPPFTVTFAGSPFNYLPGAIRGRTWFPASIRLRPDWDIGPNRFPTQAQVPYLNAAAFAYPAAFTAGTMGRNVVEAPGLTWPQFSLSKQWSFFERARFILRWDMNNPFKSPNYGGPDSTYNLQNLANFGRIGTCDSRRVLGRRNRAAESSAGVSIGVVAREGPAR